MEGRAVCALSASILGAILIMGLPGSRAGADQRASVTHVCVFDHVTLRTEPGTCRPRAASYPPDIKGRVRQAIYDSALTFGIPYPILLGIARCESGLNPRADNGSHFGLFQFLPETFQRGARSLRAETGIIARSYWNPLDASYVAGYLFATGKSGRWSCEPASPGS